MYLLGYRDENNNSEALIIKMDGNGNVLWEKELNDSNNKIKDSSADDHIRAAVIDNDESNLYFAVETFGNFGQMPTQMEEAIVQ